MDLQAFATVYNAPYAFSWIRPPNAMRKGGKAPPPDDTLEEAAYLKSLGEKQKNVSIKLVDGDVVQGRIEYCDKNIERTSAS